MIYFNFSDNNFGTRTGQLSLSAGSCCATLHTPAPLRNTINGFAEGDFLMHKKSRESFCGQILAIRVDLDLVVCLANSDPVYGRGTYCQITLSDLLEMEVIVSANHILDFIKNHSPLRVIWPAEGPNIWG